MALKTISLKQSSRYKNQILGTFSICSIAISHGIVLSWMSPAILHLRSEFSPFPVTSEEISMFIIVFLIGCLVLGCILTGIVVDYIGRKMAIWLLGIPHVGFWVLVYCANNVYYLYAARILCGFTTGGIMITISASITEFSSKNIRPNLTSCFPLSINVGRLLGGIIMGYTSYDINPYIFVGIPIIYLIVFGLCPETPQQLLRRGKDAKAKDSLRFYRNFKKGEENAELDNLFNEMKTTMIESGQMGRVTLKDFKSKQVFSAIFQASIVIFLHMSNGTLIIFNAVGSLYEKLESDPHIGTICYTLTQLFSSIAITLTSNRFTRRRCLISTSCVAAVGLVASGVFSIYVDNSEVVKVLWIWHIIFNVTVFFLQFGMNSLSHCVAAELFALKTKSISLAITYSLAYVLSFGVTSAFPYILLEYGRFGAFYALLMCACVCFFGTLFYTFVLTETSKKDI